MAIRVKERGGLAPHKYLSREQVRQLRAYVKAQAEQAHSNTSRRDVVNEMIVELLLFSGLRARELCQLKVRDLPLSHGKNSIYVRDGKGRVSRVVEIPADLVTKLEHFIKFHWSGAKPDSAVIPSEQGYRKVHWRSYRLRKNRRPGESKYIIEKHQEYTAGLTYHSLYSKVRTIGRKAKIGRLTPHQLRHSYLTRLYNIAYDIRLIQRQAGHASISTSAIYAQTEIESARRQIEAIEY